MPETDRPQTPLESQRVPLEREVVLEFEHFSSFIREYSANISLGGMFVKTDQPHLPDTVFRFEVRLADDAPLITGLARVLWVRETAGGPDQPRGMGVRFLQLEEEGRVLIERIVRDHVDRGGQPFQLEEEPETASAGDEGPDEAQEPRDRSAVIELPPLEQLLEEARSPRTGRVSLDTPPSGWKPGISVARPQTRPQLVARIAAAAAILGAIVFFLVRLFAAAPVLEESETAPPELPRPATAENADEAPAEPLPPFTVVEDISWRRAGNSAEILVRLDGSLPDGSWSVDRLSDPPRHLLKFQGATRAYPTETYDVGLGGVRQLRTGFHDGGAGDEQHVVIDLVDPRVVLEEAVAEGDTVRLRFRRLP